MAPAPPATSSLPPATAGFTITAAALSLICVSSSAAFALFSLKPGDTVLGERRFWSVLTGYMVESSVVKVRA